MQTRTFPSTLITALLLLLAGPLLHAIPQPHPLGNDTTDQSLAPSFQILGTDSSTESFPLKSTQVKATLSGVIADVTVEQRYTNTGATPIEALYTFPASNRAAVHGVEMRIGQRLIKAKIQEKTAAKATFEKAKSENKTAALLEQHRPNVFQMSVANILPGDEVHVILHYSEKLKPGERVYEFIYPTVVGPRYAGPGARKETWVHNPYLAEGIASPASFSLDLTLNAGLPLQSLSSPSHQPVIQYHGPDLATVTLNADASHANRDFVLRYQLADKQVASGLLLHQNPNPDGENFFLLNLQPPARPTPAQIPARDYLFILDVSGSMSGFPIDTAKTLLRDLVNGMRPTDTFNILLFAGSSDLLSPTALPATQANLTRANRFLDQSKAGGGTELLPALQRAFAMPRQENVSRNLVLITDGYVSIEKEAFQLISEKLNRANLFTFGIGSSVNRWLIESLAQAGKGEPFIVLDPGEAPRLAERFRHYISSPVLTDIEISCEGFATHHVEPAAIPDVFAERPIELIGKWSGSPSGRITVRGKTGGVPYHASFDVAAEAGKGAHNPSLRALWALDRVRALGAEAMLDRNPEHVKTITNLGLTYNLLTEHTSFVAVDETPREILAQLQTVTQPLPLPQGVSNQAIGSSIAVTTTSNTSSVPEPGVISLLIITAALLMLHRQRRLAH